MQSVQQTRSSVNSERCLFWEELRISEHITHIVVQGDCVRLARQQQFGERFTAAYLTPDPAQMRRFVSSVNFYRRDDAVIRAARALQRAAKSTSRN